LRRKDDAIKMDAGNQKKNKKNPPEWKDFLQTYPDFFLSSQLLNFYIFKPGFAAMIL
jgi:hypothetical protein